MSKAAIRYDLAFDNPVSDKRVDILRALGETGSISEAARQCGVSYKAAWQAVETLSNLAGVPLVHKSVGGTGGGGAQLTEAGLQVLEAAAELQEAQRRVMDRLKGSAGFALDTGRLASLGLRTSMRNHLPAVVRAVRAQAGHVRVQMELLGGLPLHATITRESRQLLGLEAGLQVLALCKASGVVLNRDDCPSPGVNALPGQVSRVAPAKGPAEATVQLAPGLQLVGFADPNLRQRLAVGQPVTAHVPEAAVVIGLLG